MGMNKKILVIGETDQNNRLTSLTGELLGGARKLAYELGGGMVELFLIMSGSEQSEGDAFCRGVDRVYLVTQPGITVFDMETITAVVSEICKTANPALCLLGQTDMGRDLAPSLAARIGAGLAMDCTDVKYEPETDRFIQTRPAYGGKAVAVVASEPGKMQIDTIRPKSLSPADNAPELVGEKVLMAGISPAQIKIKLTSCETIQEEGIRLEDAKTIVAGGGGLGGAAGFKLIGELAQVLNAAVGATRVPVDEKWVPHHMEIGQTGKIVSPDLYIAVGISGATQHITGCLGSGKIVAINKDPDANIFRVADYGLVADYKEALPFVIASLKAGK
jgi:electron transfer flavoprotein alpha subunit